MRSLRAFFAMVALVAVALLPGPSHALAAASVEPAQMHVHGDHRHAAHHHADGAVRADMMAAAQHHGSQAPCLPCKTCSLACCAPVTAAVSAPLLAVIDARPLRRQRLEPDLARQGATSRPALRPPAFRSA